MKVVTDCAADMSAEELEKLEVIQAPLFIQFPEGEVNAVDISPDDFYNRLEVMRPAIPTTAQPSSGIFAELYRKVAEKEKDIFSSFFIWPLRKNSQWCLMAKLSFFQKPLHRITNTFVERSW